jgi:hypothetical protein
MLWEVLTFRPPSILVTIGMLREESLCHLPIVVESVFHYCRAKAEASSGAAAILWAPKSNIDNHDIAQERESLEMHKMEAGSGDNSVGSRSILSVSVDSGSMIRERKKTEPSVVPVGGFKAPTPRGGTAKREQQKSAFASVFSKFSPSGSGAPNPNMMGTVAQMTKGMSADEKLLVEVGDMEFAFQTMCVLGLRPPMPVGLPADLEEILQSCWDFDIKKRPTFPQILTSLDRYFKQCTDPLSLPLELYNEINYSSNGSAQLDNI